MIRAFLVILFLASGSAALREVVVNAPRSDAAAVSQALPEAPPAPVVEVVTVPIVTAARAIAAGQELAPEDVVWTDVPQSAIDAHVLTGEDVSPTMEDLVGQVALRDVAEGAPVTIEDLRGPASESLSGRLAPGMRAFSVPIEVESMAGGLILPGDRVDVVYTYFPETSETAVSVIVASDIRLLALDDMTAFTRRGLQDEGGQPNERNATLELSPDQIGVISAAESNGRLRLALRSADEIAAPIPVRSPVIRINRGGEISLEVR